MSFSRKHTFLIFAVCALGLFFLTIIFFRIKSSKEHLPHPEPPVVKVETKAPAVKVETIGVSIEGRKIQVYSYGTGKTHLAFIGGIHGGYEWNSVLLSYQLMDYLAANPDVIPSNITILVVPSANPDGIYKVTGKEGRFTSGDVTTDKVVLASARFNANGVDLNRNFDCKWQPKSTWQNKTVSAGTAPFSEPEAQAIQKFVHDYTPSAVVLWHSQANSVYASQCESGILPETLVIMNAYAKASGYAAIKAFDAYATTGAAEDWLSSINIPSITVELKTHETTEWERNLAGVKALIEYVSSNAIVKP